MTDHLLIDMNDLLYTSFNKAREFKYFMAHTFTILDNILKNVQPQETTLVLAFDGPAPFAKMQTLRHGASPAHELSHYPPGTDFMSSMEEVMTPWSGNGLQWDHTYTHTHARGAQRLVLETGSYGNRIGDIKYGPPAG